MNRRKVEKNAQLPQDIEIFKMLEEHFRWDIREFWARANFYLLVQAGLLSVFAATYSTSTRSGVISISIAILGLVIAIFWFIVLRGSVKWLQRWRKEMIRLDKELDRFQCFASVENFAEQRPLLSPSYATQFLPLVFVIAWLGLLLFS